MALGCCFRHTGSVERARETLKAALASARHCGYLKGLVDGNCESAIVELMDENDESFKTAEKRMRTAYLLTRQSLRRDLGINDPNLLAHLEDADEPLDETASLPAEDEKIEERKTEVDMVLRRRATRQKESEGGGEREGGGRGGSRILHALDAEKEKEKKRREHVSVEMNRKMRVKYGILSGIQVFPALANATYKPPVQDIRAEIKAMINWKNNGLLALTGARHRE